MQKLVLLSSVIVNIDSICTYSLIVFGLVSTPCCFCSANMNFSLILNLNPNFGLIHKFVGMDGYPIRLSGSGWISTIRRNPTPVGYSVSSRIKFPRILSQCTLVTGNRTLITESTSVRQFAAYAARRLHERCWADSLLATAINMTHD